MTTTSKASASKTKSTSQDAIVMLTDDHKRVKDLFKQFEDMKEDASAEEKQALVTTVCNELKIHAEVEEEIFYPAVRQAIDNEDLLDEAEVEHASAKELIAQLDEMDPDEDLYDAKVKVLGEYIDHHVKEEEGEMFPKAKKAKLDTAALGEEMTRRKLEMIEEMGLTAEDNESEEDDEEVEDDGDLPPGPPKKSTSKGKAKA